MSIRILKLVSGEEIIADVSGVSTVDDKEVMEDKVLVSKAVGILFTPAEEGLKIQYYPWAMYLDNTVETELDSRNIMFPAIPPVKVRNQYAEMVGLPVIPDNSIIIPESTPNLKLST